MNEPKLWTDEYFIDYIERKIKHDISMKYFVHHERKPTKEEYEFEFKSWISQLKCEVNDFDLGIYYD